MNTSPRRDRLDWLEPLKAFALLGILLNHFVEEFGPGPWFTNPSNAWPDLATRLHTWPSGPLPVALVRWLGWLGDSGPGVFILASGVGLTYAALRRPRSELAPRAFFRRRIVRLYPLLVTMHLVILALALVVPGNTLALSGPKTLLSILGLRFTPELFFYLSPSWWFVWLILQLYLVFPLLYLLLDRVGVRWFLAITCAFTFASRALGILYSGDLYFWMTGLFFGTRLAEFAVGMAIAALVSTPGHQRAEPLGAGRALLGGSVTYVVGLGASLTLVGTVVSNLLVTLGLSALGYAAWIGLVRRHAVVARATVWVGAASYAVFLLHQPPLMWTGELYAGSDGTRVAAALGVLALSFPTGWSIDRAVTGMLNVRPGPLLLRLLRWLAIVATLGAGMAIVLVEPHLLPGSWRYRVFAILLGGSLAVLAGAEWMSPGTERGVGRLARRAALLAGIVALFVFPPGFGDAALALGILILSLHAFTSHLIRTPLRAWALAVFLAGLVIAPVEVLLRRIAPLEAGRWGERPALEAHPTRVYGLRPNRQTRLRYNDYDYVVKANSQGLASPEIAATRPSPGAMRVLVIGDAFSMPEGLSYERAYPAFLQDILTLCLSPRPVQVINAGVTGYGPREELAQLRELVPLYKPDVVVYEFFINEFEDISVSPEERLRSIGLVGPPRSNGLGAVARSQVAARLRRLFRALLETVTGRPSDQRYGKALLGFYQAGENPLYADDNLTRLRSFLEPMGRVVREAGGRMAIYFVPGAVAVSRPSDIAYFPRGEDLADTSKYDLGRPLRDLRSVAAPLAIPVVDLTPYLREHVPQPVYFPTAWHWNEAGHRAAASAIGSTLAGLGYLGGVLRSPGCRAAATISEQPR